MKAISSLLASAISLAVPLMFASVGEIFTQLSGVRNIGLEGVMLIGAVSSYIAAVKSGNVWVGVVAAVLVGGLVGLIYAAATVTLQAKQTVCGLAMVTLGTGISGFIGTPYAGAGVSKFNSFTSISIPVLSKIPFLGRVLFQQCIMVYFLYLFIPASYIFINRTRAGLKLRALGENPGALDSTGANVYALRYGYVIFGTILTSLGGAYLTLAYTPIWSEGMTAGVGWIAGALVIFSVWNPLRAMGGALLFGGIQVAIFRLQVAGVNVPSFFLSMLPYLCTVVVLIVSTGNFRKTRTPAPLALGKYYDREAR